MKNTNDLQEALMEAPDLNRFLDENRENFNNTSVADSLNQMILKQRISKSALARQSGMSEVYLHQVFSGRRTPSRTRLLCMCFGLQATVEEAQVLLKQCGYAPLYPKNRRDAILLYGLSHKETLFQINDTLFDKGEETLY
ncbi:MAG: helix-turn-helix transcriptional regulator [Candidatus Faecousia sp.]|nr:helix-turn-helix transcriptional regulator [Candidatus Faecousia sp.]